MESTSNSGRSRPHLTIGIVGSTWSDRQRLLAALSVSRNVEVLFMDDVPTGCHLDTIESQVLTLKAAEESMFHPDFDVDEDRGKSNEPFYMGLKKYKRKKRK